MFKLDNNTWINIKDSIEQGLEESGVDWILEECGGNYKDLIENIMYKLIRVIEG